MAWQRRMRVIVLSCVLWSVVAAAFAQQDAASQSISQTASVLERSAYTWTLVADGFDSPIGLTYAPDDSGRVFVWEQGGLIWPILPDGTVPFDPFLDLSGMIPSSVAMGGYSEQGLLGLAFHPNYAENGLFFAHFTDTAGDTVIARFQVSADDPDLADPATMQILLTVDQPFANHNGGHMAFGPDGYLYIGLGDGGDQGDPFGNAQNPAVLLGKILRINVNADTYTAPPDNPFSTDPAFAPEVWAMGFRNPWRFSFDRATGDLFIADVGEWLWEEINYQPAGMGAGANFGWNLFESRNPRTPDADPLAFVAPIAEYSHSEGCSVTGGYVYRGAAMPDAQGVYFFGDYCNGSIWNAWRDDAGVWQAGLFEQSGRQITSFGEDQAGELYLVDYKGDVLRLSAAS
ncbi:MAG: PQQ-dependent sugar dehydrogenase [bacterium]|nr:PQQ-dependent sugar dehydrogenase [bacterium]